MNQHLTRPGYAVAASLAAAALGWIATCSWRGMVADPSQYLVPALVVALLVGGTGALGRSLRLRWYAVLGVQVVTVLIWFHQRLNPNDLLGGWVPSPDGLATVIQRVGDGAEDVNRYAAPLPTTFVDAPVYLIACAALVLLLVDLVGCGLRMPAWAGLPVLVAVTIPISILDGGLPTDVYVATALLFALLLAVTEAEQVTTWGPPVGQQGVPIGLGGRFPALALGGPALAIGATATALALAVSLGIPLGKGLLRDRSDTPGNEGPGQITLTNPLVDLRRDLVRTEPVTLLEARTEARDRSYLRLTILDSFADGAWTPSPRDLSSNRRADGPLPSPAGLISEGTGPEVPWELRTTDAFTTTWLPTPPVTRSITVSEGDWRFDPAFVDIASADEPPPTGVDYRLTATPLNPLATDLEEAGTAPIGLLQDMTALPTIPDVVRQIAQQVTAPGRTTHAKAVLLQNWFRNAGGFTYSLAPAPGSGVEQLARFVTTDKTGYCEQFAAAMAVMARSIGIPARVVVGFLDPSENGPRTARYTSDDLHAWPEVFFPGSGWVRFEPTPSSRTGSAPTWTRGEVDEPSPAPTPDEPTAAPSPLQPDRPAPAEPSDQPEVVDERSQGALVLGILAAVVLIGLLLGAPALLRVRQRRSRLRVRADSAAALEEHWRELGATCRDVGAPWSSHRSPRMVAADLVGWVDSAGTGQPTADERENLASLVAAIERCRYARTGTGRGEMTSADVARARTTVEQWSRLALASVAPRQAWLARWAPRSLVAPGATSERRAEETVSGHR